MLWFAVACFWCQSSIDVSSNVCSYYFQFGVLGVGVRLIRQTLLSYDNVSLIPNYPVG